MNIQKIISSGHAPAIEFKDVEHFNVRIEQPQKSTVDMYSLTDILEIYTPAQIAKGFTGTIEGDSFFVLMCSGQDVTNWKFAMSNFVELTQVIVNQYERNGYDDSDFFVTTFDRATGIVTTDMYASTRFGASRDIRDDFLPASEATDADIEGAKKYLRDEDAKLNQARKVSALEINDVKVGDTVRVVKGRKYSKGDEFVVLTCYEYNDPYGRKVADYLTGDGFKINEANVEIVSQGEYFDNAFADFSCLTRN